EELGLGRGDIDELLPKFVVREPLDLPCHRLCRMFRFAVARAEHHDGRPPPPVEGILRHLLLLAAAPAKSAHALEALALVKTLLLADPHHRACIRPVGTADRKSVV